MPDQLEEARALLKRAQEFVGEETSLEAQKPHTWEAFYPTPLSAGERLRIEAVKADRHDALIRDIREFLRAQDA